MGQKILLYLLFILLLSVTAMAINCGETIIENTTLDEDVICYVGLNEKGIIIGENDITLDCNYHYIKMQYHEISTNATQINNTIPQYYRGKPNNVKIKKVTEEKTRPNQGKKYGVYIEGKTGVTIKNCPINNFNYGIYLNESSENIIEHNFLEGNSYNNNDFNAYENAESNNNNWDGNSWSDYSGTGNYEIPGEGEGEDNYPINIECGDTITENIILTSDLLNCQEDGIIIEEDNILIDCNNHQLEGNDRTDDGIYILEKEGVTIKNCEIEEFRYAIYLRDGDGHDIIENVVKENNMGIRVCNSDNNEIKKNEIKNNEFRGIYVSALSDNNNIEENILIDNEDFGIALANASGNIIQNNIINNSEITTEYGIRITFSSESNEITNNLVNQNEHGIMVGLRCEDNEITNNLITENELIGTYIDSTQTDENLFSNNIFLNNYVNAWEETGTGTNYWDLNEIGNYWDDHNCIDDLEPIGICDNTYIFPGNQDNYPLVNPIFWEINRETTRKRIKNIKEKLKTLLNKEEAFLKKSTNRRIKELKESLEYDKIDTDMIKNLILEIEINMEKLKDKKLIQEAEQTIKKAQNTLNTKDNPFNYI